MTSWSSEGVKPVFHQGFHCCSVPEVIMPRMPGRSSALGSDKLLVTAQLLIRLGSSQARLGGCSCITECLYQRPGAATVNLSLCQPLLHRALWPGTGDWALNLLWSFHPPVSLLFWCRLWNWCLGGHDDLHQKSAVKVSVFFMSGHSPPPPPPPPPPSPLSEGIFLKAMRMLRIFSFFHFFSCE